MSFKNVTILTGNSVSGLVTTSNNVYTSAADANNWQIARYTKDLNLQWVIPLRSTASTCKIISTFVYDGAVLVAGGCGADGTLYIGDTDVKSTHCNWSGFAAKVSPEGKPLWIHSMSEKLNAVVTDWNGGAYVSGMDTRKTLSLYQIRNSETFQSLYEGGPGQILCMIISNSVLYFAGFTVLSLKAANDGALYSMDLTRGKESISLNLAISSLGNDAITAMALSTDQKYLYLAGYFEFSITVGAFNATTKSVDFPTTDVFVAEMDVSSSEILWLSTGGSTANDYVETISVLDDGSVAIGGLACVLPTTFTNPPTTIQFGECMVPCSSNQLYLVKFNNQGVAELLLPTGPSLASQMDIRTASHSLEMAMYVKTTIGPHQVTSGLYVTKLEEITCSGALWNQSNVCSGHGQCMDFDTCVCSGYTGANCEFEYYTCNGTDYRSDSVCSAHGICQNLNVCSCQHGWAGDWCELPICFGKIHGINESVCSAHGYCVGTDDCKCDNGYRGSECDSAVCFGLLGDHACSSHGLCVTANNCECDPGWIGDVPFCNSISANDSSVCSGASTCVSHNECRCISGTTMGECNDYKLAEYPKTKCKEGTLVMSSPLTLLHTASFKALFYMNSDRRAIFLDLNILFFNSTRQQNAVCEIRNFEYLRTIVTEDQLLVSTRSEQNYWILLKYDLNALFTGKCEPILSRKVENVTNIDYIHVLNKHVVMVTVWSNTVDNFNFEGCSFKIPRPEYVPLPAIFIFELDSTSFCMNRLLTSIPLNNDMKPEYLLTLSRGLILRYSSTHISYLNYFELFGSTTISGISYLSESYNPQAGLVAVDNKHKLLFLSRLIIDQNTMDVVDTLDRIFDLGPEIYLFHSEGYTYLFARSGSIKGKLKQSDFLAKLDGTEVLWTSNLDLTIQNPSGAVVVQFYVETHLNRYHFMLVDRTPLYVQYQPEDCQADAQNKRSNFRYEYLLLLLIPVAMLVFIIALVPCVLYIRKEKEKDYMNMKLLDHEYSFNIELSDNLNGTVHIDFNEMKIVARLDEGGGGSVYRGTWFQQPVAIKRLNITDEESFIREVQFLNKLRHPNVLNLFGYSIDSRGDKYIVTELIPQGSLDKALYSGKLDLFDLKLKALHDIALGISYLHSRNPMIVHRDIKPQNILIDASGVCKICDFGVSKAADASYTIGISYGTIQYICPELLNQTGDYDETCDSYSFGIMMNEIFCRAKPYQKGNLPLNVYSLGAKITGSGLRPDVPVTDWYDTSDEELVDAFLKTNKLDSSIEKARIAQIVRMYYDLCSRCWSSSSTERPRFGEIVQTLEGIISLYRTTDDVSQ